MPPEREAVAPRGEADSAAGAAAGGPEPAASGSARGGRRCPGALPWRVSSAGRGGTAVCCFAASLDVACAQIAAGKGQVCRRDWGLPTLIEHN